MVQQVVLEPNSASAGGVRIFRVKHAQYNTQHHQLVLHLRDGKMCVELLGEWKMTVSVAESLVAHSIAEAERIHSAEPLIVGVH